MKYPAKQIEMTEVKQTKINRIHPSAILKCKNIGIINETNAAITHIPSTRFV